ncbi:MAG: FkbM family methyltransferase [Bacteroidota bacterium]
MQPEDLLSHKKNVFSQNGEDGIIEFIFSRIGAADISCCEFGAWDGIHFSNCRNLILGGWRAVMIEGDEMRFHDLVATYRDNPAVICMNRFVDTAANRLDQLLKESGVGSLDFLSIDIDGLDYELFENLTMQPRVVCVEVNAGHNPKNGKVIPAETAKNNVGQSLAAFTKIAAAKGYGLVCYSGNAFFVRKEIIQQYALPSLSPGQAYKLFLAHLTQEEKDWLYLVNQGLVDPFYKYANPFLESSALGINVVKAIALKSKIKLKQFLNKKN